MVARLLLLICVLAGLVSAQTLKNHAPRKHAVKSAAAAPAQPDYRQVELADCASTPEEYQGKLVTVTADVISVDAKYQGINIFDTNSKTLMGVSLTRLPKAQRRWLVTEPVHRVAVYGNVATKDGRCLIEAHKVVPMIVDTSAQVPGR